MAAWAPYLTGDGGTRPDFPYVRRRGPVALIGVSSAIATGPFMATGHVARPQLDRLADLLRQAEAEGLARIVLMHHLCIDGATKPLARLLEANRFREVIAAAGAELILHGHTHRASINWISGPERSVPVVGVQAASLRPATDRHGAGWNLFEIEGTSSDWHITLSDRSFGPVGTQIAERARTVLTPG
jgi:3',5'-cyclic AMP phosphodiesterase CpdA